AGVNLLSGYVFRPWNTVKNVVADKPLSSSVVNERLKGYLQCLNIWEGETPHVARSGVALCLSWLGIDREAVKAHLNWKSDKMYYHYTRENTVMQKYSSASVLSRCKYDSEFKDKIGFYRGATTWEKVIK
ncbi:MAG: hypothetical protein AB2705_22010, partial [Candidatus Thiodiazotropha sp.]